MPGSVCTLYCINRGVGIYMNMHLTGRHAHMVLAVPSVPLQQVNRCNFYQAVRPCASKCLESKSSIVSRYHQATNSDLALLFRAPDQQLELKPVLA